MKIFFRYLRNKPLALISVFLLAFLYFVMVFADFFAPYSAGKSYENNTFHPANVQLTVKGLKVREYRVINKSTWRYVRVKDSECIHNVKFFVKGSSYKLFGIIPSDRHLFGSDSDYPVYLLGADNLGRDLFSRIVFGSRISLTIGFLATAISLLLAVILGGLSGYFGSVTDWAIMRFAEFFMLIPSLYFILFLRSLLNSRMDSGTSYMVITVILALVGWPGSARTIRGMVHSIKREEFVIDADLEGLPSLVIIFRHIIPQISSLLIVSTALSVPGFIMSETTLSYLGLGISDPSVSWGALINRDISTLSNLRNFPWLLYPVFMLLLVTLAFNFLGDALRDFYDPFSSVFKKKKISFRQNISYAVKNREALLSVEDLHVSFNMLQGAKKIKKIAVDGVSFYINKGEILGLVGESGSGKSVSTSAIPALLSQNAEMTGHIYYKGRDLTLLSQEEMREYRGKKIALIFQEPGRSFDPLQNIGNVFFETFKIIEPSITKNESDEKAVELLEEVGLPDPLGRLAAYPHQFSGGQLQRIGIALALAQNCELLIADEPTTALDVTIQAQIVSLLLKLKESRGLSIIFISHDINLVARISDRICVMYHGKVMECDKADVIMNNPSHSYTKALISAVPEFGSHYEDAAVEEVFESVLSVENLSKHFNLEAGFFAKNRKTVYAVNDVSFKIPRGQTYGIVGESGCGKTTTARLIIQMYKKSSGKIAFLGKDISELNRKELRNYREKVKYIFQDPAKSLNPRMTVYEVLTSALRYSSLWKGKENARELAEKIIQEVGLSVEDLSRCPAEFSGGQRQRISIARGLIMNPELLICDEVVSALDVSIQSQILNLLQDLRKSRNLSFIFITHDLKVACYFCDKIGVMYRGVMVEEGPAENMYRDALHPYTKLLFDGAKGLLSSSNLEVKSTLEEEKCCPYAGRCPKANEKCLSELPPFVQVKENHKVRCFNLDI